MLRLLLLSLLKLLKLCVYCVCEHCVGTGQLCSCDGYLCYADCCF